MALTAKDLQEIAKLVGLAIDERNLTTKSFTQEYLDEALSNFRLSLNKDMSKFATKDDLANLVSKEDLSLGLSGLKKELTDYIHEVADSIVNGFSDTMEEHLSAYHGKTSPPAH